MKTTTLAKTAALLAGALLMSACEDQGPLERAGEEIDEGIEDIRNGGETTGNRIDDAIDDVRNAADDVGDELSQ